MASSGDGSICRPRRSPPHPAVALVASVAATTTAAREGIWSTVLRHRTTAGCTVSSKPVPSAPLRSPSPPLSLSACVSLRFRRTTPTGVALYLERKKELSLCVYLFTLSSETLNSTRRTDTQPQLDIYCSYLLFNPLPNRS